MAKTTKVKKLKTSKIPDSSICTPKPDKKLKKKKLKLTTQKSKPKSKSKSKIKTKPLSSSSSSSSSSDSEPESEKIQNLLQPCSKHQLIDLVTDAALSSPSFFSKIRELADKDIAHRKIFVHGLSWDTTNETLISAFQKFGEIENCNVVLDKVTKKAKGYGFVTFKTRKSALKALKHPKMEINSRVVIWQLASLGPPSSSSDGNVNGNVNGSWNLSGRKIYVSNVTSEVSAERLKAFFAKFGEIESGPMGFDVQTGKFKGYALFVYKTVEGAKKALEEPNKMFEGHQLHCQKAAEGKKNVGGAAGITTAVQPVPPVYAAVAGQNMGLFRQNPNVDVNPAMLSVNPLYGSLLACPSAAAAGLMNVSPLGTLGQGGMEMGFGGYGGVLGTHGLSSLGSGGATTMLGSYGGSAVSSGAMMQGLHCAYPGTQMGQKSSSAPASGTSRTVG